ncbi:MAG: D-aminoacylase [Actinomycetota bacterium]|nr:D-aminoacylase [Actinomycetota bacterium]MDD5666825.1 D-aminoacylase [Actinomycetota bacterium]
MLDVLIRRGRVVDGTGAPARMADLAVKDGRIVEVGDLPETGAERVIDAEGKVVSPGFVDIHTHNDLFVVRDDYVQLFEPYVRQGITTSVVSNCGWSVAPWLPETSALFRSTLQTMGVSRDFEPGWETVKEFNGWMLGRGLPINFVPLSAHGPIRIAAMGENARFCSEDELEKMKKLVRKDMEDGCRGFSTGLTYFPGMYAHTDEIVALAGVAAEYGGRYVTHLRSLTNTFDRAVREAIEIADRSGSTLQISHFGAFPYLGSMADILYEVTAVLEKVNRLIPLPGLPNAVSKRGYRLVDEALAGGMDVGMDFIPSVGGNTTVTQLYPPWSLEGGTEALLRRLADPVERERIRHDVKTVKDRWPQWEKGAWATNYLKCESWKMLTILSIGSEKNAWMEGKRVVDLAREAGKDNFDFLADLAIEEEGAIMFFMGMPPKPWVEKAMMIGHDHPQLSVGSDVIFSEKGIGPQPAYGCFPRILEHYARDLGLYTLEGAVHRCTGLAASRFGLEDRGVLREGAAADITVFDFENVRDNSTFDDPRRYPDGIDCVLVNGRVVLENGEFDAGAMAGDVLAR